jgi:hypothetical protein
MASSRTFLATTPRAAAFLHSQCQKQTYALQQDLVLFDRDWLFSQCQSRLRERGVVGATVGSGCALLGHRRKPFISDHFSIVNFRDRL